MRPVSIEATRSSPMGATFLCLSLICLQSARFAQARELWKQSIRSLSTANSDAIAYHCASIETSVSPLLLPVASRLQSSYFDSWVTVFEAHFMLCSCLGVTWRAHVNVVRAAMHCSRLLPHGRGRRHSFQRPVDVRHSALFCARHTLLLVAVHF